MHLHDRELALLPLLALAGPAGREAQVSRHRANSSISGPPAGGADHQPQQPSGNHLQRRNHQGDDCLVPGQPRALHQVWADGRVGEPGLVARVAAAALAGQQTVPQQAGYRDRRTRL